MQNDTKNIRWMLAFLVVFGSVHPLVGISKFIDRFLYSSSYKPLLGGIVAISVVGLAYKGWKEYLCSQKLNKSSYASSHPSAGITTLQLKLPDCPTRLQNNRDETDTRITINSMGIYSLYAQGETLYITHQGKPADYIITIPYNSSLNLKGEAGSFYASNVQGLKSVTITSKNSSNRNEQTIAGIIGKGPIKIVQINE